MKKNSVNEVINSLSGLGEHRFIEGATEEQISSFEKENNVKLPQGVKDWLAFSDGGELFLPAGVQLYGVVHGPLISVDNNVPSSNYYCIGVLSNGDPIICEKNEERISIYNQEAGRIEQDEMYENFSSFLKDLPKIVGY